MIECKSCGFELSDLPAVLAIEARDGVSKILTCPACAQSIELCVQDFGILVRGSGAATSFAKWKLSAKDEAGPNVRVGRRLTLRFEDLGSIEPRDVCYPRVPAFLTEDGKIIYPDVPIRHQYVDCFDDERAREHLKREPRLWDVVGSQYQVLLHLKGLKDPVRLTLQTLAPENGPPSKENAYRDLNLKIWPNINIKEWSYYLIGVAGSGPKGDVLIGERRVRALARGRQSDEWAPLDVIQRAGSSYVHSMKERPSLVAIEIAAPERAADPEGGLLGGGLFLVPDAGATLAEGTQVEMGLDFGTSNTCIALKGYMTATDSGKPELLRRVSEVRWNLYLVRGGPENSTPAGPDLWPSPHGFGEHGDVIPSELIFPKPRRDMAQAMGAIADWQFGVDFGIPGSSVVPQFSEADYVLGDFKWRSMVQASAPVFFPKIDTIQAQYLTGALMVAFVRAAVASGQVARRANVIYSFPMAFSEDELPTLRGSLSRAVEQLDRLTGVEWNAKIGVDESAAAALNAGETSANLLVYLDMGGGSTDIGVKLLRGNKAEEVYLTSVAYAGSALLAGYAGAVDPNTSKVTGSCLAGKASLDTLRRRVREAKLAKDVLGDPTLFNSAYARVVQTRTRHFYGYLIEYVARIIAAGFLDQRFRDNPSEPGPPRFPGQISISFFFLGNGWGFASLFGAKPTQDIARQIFDRVFELVEQESSPYGEEVKKGLSAVEVSYEVGQLRDVPHSKAAVALGLLSDGAHRAGHESKEFLRGSVLGITTKVDGRQVPWFVKCSNAGKPPAPGAGTAGGEGSRRTFGAKTAPAANESLRTSWYESPLRENDRLDWEDAPPLLPDTLEKPFDLDKGLNGTRGALRAQCEPRSGWFPRGAYEVLLESLFKPKLREIT